MNMPRSTAMQFAQSFSGIQSLNDASGRVLPEMQESLNSLLRNPTTTPSENDASILAPVQEDDENFIQPDILNRTGQRFPQPTRSLEGNFLSLPDTRYHCEDANQEGMVGDGGSLMDEGDVQPPELLPSQGRHSERQLDSLDTHAAQSSERDTSSQETGTTDIGMADIDQPQAQSTSSPSSDLLSDVLPRLDEGSASLLEFLKRVPKEYLEKALKREGGDSHGQGEASSQESSSSKTQHACPDCTKTFNRPCELKYVSAFIVPIPH